MQVLDRRPWYEIAEFLEEAPNNFRRTRFLVEELVKLFLERRDLSTQIVRNKHIDVAFIDQILLHADREDLHEISRKNCLSHDHFDILYEQGDSAVRGHLAHHKKVPHELLVKLSIDKYDFVRETALLRLERMKE